MNFSSLALSSFPERLAITESEVHVWTVFLDYWEESLSRLSDQLDTEELLLAACFRLERDRQRFVIRRTLLKKLLSFYLGIPPRMIRCNYGQYGKPYLSIGSAIQFNTSHSQGLAIYAIGCQRHLGVDLEAIQPVPEIDALINRWFPSREARSLQHLSPQEKQEAFYRLWTKKEAYLKALGRGLGGPQDLVEFFPKDLSSAQHCPAGDFSRMGHWSFRVLTPAPNFVAALAVEGGDYRLHCFKWEAGIDLKSNLCK